MRFSVFKALLVCSFFAVGARDCCIPPIQTGERFVLAFKQDGTNRIRVRYSEDGITWTDGAFPAAATSGATFTGAGAAADHVPLLHQIWFATGNRLNVTWGLGPSVWDTSASSDASAPPVSAPSVASLGDGFWAVAFRQTGDTVAVHVFSTETRGLLGLGTAVDNFAPQDALNGTVMGRPAITAFRDRVLLAWRQQGELVTAVGTVVTRTVDGVTERVPSFGAPTTFPLPGNTEFRAGLQSDPDLTHDHTRFYVAFVREERGGGAGTLHGWRTRIHSSPDGATWTLENSPVSLSLPMESRVNIAAHSDGTIIAAQLVDKGSFIDVKYARRHGGSWTHTDRADAVSDVFGSTPAVEQFALVATGSPPSR